MSLVPEFVFDNIIGGFGNFNGGSYNYYSEFYATSRGNNTCHQVFGNILDIDCSELDHTVHTNVASGLKKKVLSFENGVDLYVSLYCEEVIGGNPYGSYDVYTVYAEGCLKYRNAFIYAGDGNYYLTTAGGYSLGHQGRVLACPLNIVKNYGIKISILTNYTYGLGGAVIEQTKAAYFDIRALVPCQDSNEVSGYQSWAHIRGNSTYFTSIKDVFNDYEINPQFMSYGYDHGIQGDGVIFRCDNLESFKESLNNISPLPNNPWRPKDPETPSQEGDPSEPGGGGGNMDQNSDPIPFPELPTGGAIESGAIKAFLLPNTTIIAMFRKLWDANIFDIATFQKLVESPIDCIISLHCIPVTPETHGTSNIILGSFDTELVANVISNQYVTIDCGSLSIKEYWGSALDYSPYTKVDLYMPFIGIKQLNVDDVMNNKVHIKYNIDVLTGDCLCNVMCGNSVLYKFAGNFKMDIPVTGRTANGLLNGVKGTVDAVGGAIAGSAVGGPAFGAVTGFLSGASTVASSKVLTSRSGSLVGSVSLMDDFRPFFIFHRPIQSLAANFKGHKGYPSNITRNLSSVSGYTEVEYINLQNIPNATSAEMDEIKSLLKAGVIF